MMIKVDEKKLEFPSPTGATYYEFVVKDYTDRVYVIKEFPSPTGATYYELDLLTALLIVKVSVPNRGYLL